MVVKFGIALLAAVFVFSFFSSCVQNIPVENIKVVIVGADGTTIVEIEQKNYPSNLVVDILSANNDVLQIPQSQLDDGFITTIAGIEAVWGDVGSEWWWMFKVDGKFMMSGVSTTRVNDGQVISFTLTEGF